MKYVFNKIVEGTFEDVKSKLIESLKLEKFGVITNIDLSGIVKGKLGLEMKRYEILGACNPKYAYDAVKEDDDMGAFLPCNISLSENGAGTIKVSIVNPIPYMSSVESKEVQNIAELVSKAMGRVSDSL